MRKLQQDIEPKTSWVVGIVVPAHNEEELLGRCLTSLLKVRHRGALWIVVVADSCSDQTVSIAESMLGFRGEVVEVAKRNAGFSRSMGADRVLEQFAKTHPNSPVWLANTDADSCVPSTPLTTGQQCPGEKRAG